MRCYKIYVEDDVSVTRVAGTMAAARQARQEIVDAGNYKKKEIGIEEIDVPTKKDELLEYINGVYQEAAGG